MAAEANHPRVHPPPPPDTANTQCATVGNGLLEAAVDQAVYTAQIRIARNSTYRHDVRFAIPNGLWQSGWTCHTWEVELLTPTCVDVLEAVYQPSGRLAFTRHDRNPLVTGLNASDNRAHWIVRSHEADSQAHTYRHSYHDSECARTNVTPTYVGHYKVRVKHTRHTPYVTFSNGLTHKLFPVRFVVGES